MPSHIDIDAIRKTARSYFEDVDPSHDWHHVQRVHRLAEHVAAAEDADLTVVRMAVWLHDIGRQREDRGEIADHATWGADEAGDILEERGVAPDLVERVQHCIRAHRYSTGTAPETLEAQVVSDADNLDALGASGIARTFAYGGEHRTPLADPELPPDADDSTSGRTQLNHLHKKILDLKDRMHTETGRELARDRHAFVERFVEQFNAEMRGDR